MKLCIQEIQKNHKSALALLQFCSVISPDSIPKYLLESAVGGSITDLYYVSEELQTFSLLSVDTAGCSIHRLLQDVVRECMDL